MQRQDWNARWEKNFAAKTNNSKVFLSLTDKKSKSPLIYWYLNERVEERLGKNDNNFEQWFGDTKGAIKNHLNGIG